jgi:hypothetical protein
MAFICKKKNRNCLPLYRVVRSVREGKRVKQIMIAYLGRNATIEGRLRDLRWKAKTGWHWQQWYFTSEIEKLEALQKETQLP